MRLVTANHSSYPRVGEGQKAQRVRRAYAQRERRQLDDAGYLAVARDYISEIVREQRDAGVELVTDGQVHWYDSVSHLAAPLDGVTIDGLLRFFDTNYLVRQPEITGPVSGRIGLADDYRYLASLGAPAKPVVTGPYTLARHSITSGNGDLPKLVASYADVLAAEVAELAEAGAGLVQVEEPSLLAHPEHAELVRNALGRIAARKGTAKLGLVTYFGDAASLYGELVKMPVDMLGFDLIYAPTVADLLVSDPPQVAVALGAVDGRNTKLDDVTTVAGTIARVADALDARGVDEVHLQPSCGLEYLPRDRALRKLERMREIADAAQKVGA